MPSSTTPESFFTHTIQLPARGSAVTLPENSPTTTSSAVMPSENTNRYTNPNTPLRVVATHVSTAANAGAPHGAATTPEVGRASCRERVLRFVVGEYVNGCEDGAGY